MLSKKLKRIVGLVVGAAVLAFVLNLFFGRILAVKISTIKVLNKWQILSPQTPIIIHKKEEIRVSDSGEAAEVFFGIKPKIALVAGLENNSLVMLGTAVGLTSEGTFVSVEKVFRPNLTDFYLVYNEDKFVKIFTRFPDPATGLVFIKADINSSNPVAFGKIKDLKTGEKLFFIGTGSTPNEPRFLASYVSRSYVGVNSLGRVEPDRFDSTFETQLPANLKPGDVIVNSKAEVVGLWNSDLIIPADIVKTATQMFLVSGKVNPRPMFGFSFQRIRKIESQILGLAEGFLVKEVDVNADSPAKKAGLINGDLILKIDNENVSQKEFDVDFFFKKKPGEVLLLQVMRGKNPLDIKLTVLPQK